MNLKSLFPRASRTFLHLNEKNALQATTDALKPIYETDIDPQLQNTIPQQNKTPALDTTIQRKTCRLQRFRVRFTGYRTKPLDPDNFAASCKDLLDGLRHSGLLPDDDPWTITLETTQTKVHHYSEERTVIEIDDGELS